MAMKTCPMCGENYSDTYLNCPFCEEEETLREEEKKSGGRRLKQRGGRRLRYSMVTPVLVLLILLMSALLIYLLYGERIIDRFTGQAVPGNVTSGLQTEDERQDDTDGELGQTEEQTDDTADDAAMDYATANTLPTGLTLQTNDFTVRVIGEVTPLRVGGSAGPYTWLSQDPAIAAVDQAGNVTAVSNGTTHVIVTDGTSKAVCIVRVKSPSTTDGNASAVHQEETADPAAPASETGSAATGGVYKLNKTDFTRKPEEGSYQLKVTGLTVPVTWQSSDPAVATVSGDGMVTPVAPGTAVITASWENQSLQCIVRVPKN